jgi:protein-S-isoprenylcysteine O-methyltransferase Ste14
MSNMSQTSPEIKPLSLGGYISIFIFAPVFTYFVGNWFDRVFRLVAWPLFPLNLFGLIIIVTGAVIGIRSTRELYHKGHGLPWGETNKKAQTNLLVTTGPYHYSRNPMVIGYSMLPCGMGIIFQSIGMSLGVTAIILIVNILIVKLVEEPNMEKRFGIEYQKYKEKTPFLVPTVLRTSFRVTSNNDD